MTFLWPQAAVAAAGAAARVVGLRAAACGGGRRRRCATPGADRARWPAARAAAATCRRCCSCSRWPLLVLAVARPAAVVTLPTQHETIILADGRLGQHARDRRQAQPDRRRAGGGARLRRLPCRARPASASSRSPRRPRSCSRRRTSREDVLAAIDRFQLQRGTAIGSGDPGRRSRRCSRSRTSTCAAVPRRAGRSRSTHRATSIRRRPRRRSAEPVAPGSYARRRSCC